MEISGADLTADERAHDHTAALKTTHINIYNTKSILLELLRDDFIFLHICIVDVDKKKVDTYSHFTQFDFDKPYRVI